ncbi:MAG: hypothetical protein P4N41_18640, partial [Negativicutes bacterium]|nr:hypothetical protein [Negativicutes bacterium]
PDHRSARSALSPAGGKEGEEKIKLKLPQTLFNACVREGGRAKQRPGESTPATGNRQTQLTNL